MTVTQKKYVYNITDEELINTPILFHLLLVYISIAINLAPSGDVAISVRSELFERNFATKRLHDF